MTRFIETSPDAFPVLVSELFERSGKLIIEAPSYKDASLLNSALGIFRFRTVLFAPQYLMIERGETDHDAHTAFSKMASSEADVIITTPLSSRMLLPDMTGSDAPEFRTNLSYRISDTVSILSSMGYQRTAVVRDPGEYSVRGDIIDIGTFITGKGVRLEFFDEELEKIHLFWTSTQRNWKKLDSISIPPLLFSNRLRSDWKSILEKKAAGLSMKQILESEELIACGSVPKWEIYPLIAGDKNVSGMFKGTKIRWEKIRSDVTFDNDFKILDNERRKRASEGHFLPFEMKEYFTGSPEFDIEVSSLFSVAGNIEKYQVTHKKVPDNLKDNPLIILNKLTDNNETAVLFTKPDETEFFSDLCDKAGVDFIQLNNLPAQNPQGTIVIIEKNPWFQADSILNIPSVSSSFLSSGIFQTVHSRKKKEPEKPEYNEAEIFSLSSMKQGEYVVHYNFGVAVYEGTERVNGTDCLVLRYEKDDRLFIPVYNMHFIYKYRWEEGTFPKISSIRGTAWEAAKSKIQKEIEKVAAQILELYALRSVERTEPMSIGTQMYREFSSQFRYKETKDQAVSITELERDLASPEITDRLLCGDVGFGKTEVAMRGCMIAVSNGKQAAVLAPTTVLAFQHFKNFEERFSKMPVKVEMLSRFYSAAKQKQVLKDLKEGRIDIIIGTHRLLSNDVEFTDLGFLVVDEEHRFGVAHKERIKEIKKGVATLAMTATPIPRTLQMSLLGIRNVSFIRTPPGDRKSIRTHVLEYSEEIIRDAINSELSRDGQIYFIHNRIASLEDIKMKLQNLVPGIRIAIAHGQMDEKQLEKVMVEFVDRRFDILLSTSLIESGIDIPMVNTIIINRADIFGLAQLYQLRGRVGRWNREAKAYLFVPNLSTISQDSYSRLAVIKRFDHLGSGYDVAMEDLNIRGGGNILGMSQSGKLKGVGYDMYLEMLRKRIEELRTGIPHNDNEFDISTDLFASIPENYIPDTEMRIGFYRKIADIKKQYDLDWIRETLTEMFGKVPEETENLLTLASIKISAIEAGASAISVSRSEFSLSLSSACAPKDMEQLFKFLEKYSGSFSGTHSMKFPVTGTDDIRKIIEDLKKVL